ncbi:hypothetical protein N0V95_006173 [Ascochyta clinopodiicola]|nr:hypothetical protein N0V95_006173 [Ascochyta clinopodiicola]
MDPTTESVPRCSTPHAIIKDCADHWLICFEPDIAGIIMDEPRLISKNVTSDLYPHLAEAWEAQVISQKVEAQRIEQTFLAFMRRFNDDNIKAFTPPPPQPGVACDQHLLPGDARGQDWSQVIRVNSYDVPSHDKEVREVDH